MLRSFLSIVQPEHLLFTLPFAYVAMVVCPKLTRNTWPSGHEILWITVAMIAVHLAGMLFNRLIDRKIDADNPRTVDRPLASGAFSARLAKSIIIICLSLFIWATLQLNWIALTLVPVAILFLWGYSYTKRFTWSAHIILGIVTAFAPLGAWIAIAGQLHLSVIFFAIAMLLWVAGFDIIYACQDAEFDSAAKLHSIPAHFGIRRALQISAWMHAGTSLCWLLFMWLANLHIVFAGGWLIATSILVYEHYIVSADDMSRADVAFFQLNSAASLLLLTAAIIDVALW